MIPLDIREAVIALIKNHNASLHSAIAHQRTVETPSPYNYALRNDPPGDDTVDIRRAVDVLIKNRGANPRNRRSSSTQRGTAKRSRKCRYAIIPWWTTPWTSVRR